MARKMKKRIKECADGIAREGYGYPLYHWQETVLDDRDEPYTEQEYRVAYEWLMERLA